MRKLVLSIFTTRLLFFRMTTYILLLIACSNCGSISILRMFLRRSTNGEFYNWWRTIANTLFAVQLSKCTRTAAYGRYILSRVMILQLSPYHPRRDNEVPGLSLPRTIPKCTCPDDVRKLSTPIASMPKEISLSFRSCGSLALPFYRSVADNSTG